MVAVEVTQEVIGRSVSRSPLECPVAIALSRATGKVWCVQHRDTATLLFGGRFVRLPPQAQEFIGAFDHELPVQPISFEVDA